jgi:hypothetical protein
LIQGASKANRTMFSQSKYNITNLHLPRLSLLLIILLISLIANKTKTIEAGALGEQKNENQVFVTNRQRVTFFLHYANESDAQIERKLHFLKCDFQLALCHSIPCHRISDTFWSRKKNLIN